MRTQGRDIWPWRWFVTVVVLILVIANLVVALVAANRSADALQGAADAGREGRATANCVNNILGTRQAPTAADARAHLAFAAATAAYDRVERQWHFALTTVLAAPKAKQNALYMRFLATDKALGLATATKEAANTAYQRQLQRDQDDRDRFPLGRC